MSDKTFSTSSEDYSKIIFVPKKYLDFSNYFYIAFCDLRSILILYLAYTVKVCYQHFKGLSPK